MYMRTGRGGSMRVGVAEARVHWRDLLDRVHTGESVEITRRGMIVAVLSPPPAADAAPFVETLLAWRAEWDVACWPEDDDPFAVARDETSGREAPW